MNKVKVSIWDREFDITVSYSCYPGEQITDVQKSAVDSFLGNQKEVLRALDDLKRYVEKTNNEGVKAEQIENIFKYVMPKNLFVPRTKVETIAILCNYKFDMENGIAVVFEGGKLKNIGTEDTII